MSYSVIRPYGGSAPPLGALSVDRQILRMDGAPWQWIGSSFFNGCDLFAKGGAAAVDPFLDAYPGIRIVRVWDYVGGQGWEGHSWEPAPVEAWVEFLRHLAQRGIFVNRTALTSDDPWRIDPAIRSIEAITAAGCKNLTHEGGNEPNTHKSINTHALIPAMSASGLLWSTGDYEYSVYWRGTHGLFHPARTPDGARRAHDAYEYFHGGGPNSPDEPATHVAWVLDEPAKLEDVPTWDRAAWRSHIAASFLFCPGITIHSTTAKLGLLPTTAEQELWRLTIEVAAMITADAPLGAYRRIPAEDEPGQTEEGRTYVIGNYMVRCQQKKTGAPEPGWTPLDSDDVLFTR